MESEGWAALEYILVVHGYYIKTGVSESSPMGQGVKPCQSQEVRLG